MASVSTAPNHGHPARVGAEYPGESVLGLGSESGSRREHGSMHPAPSLFEAPPTGSPRPEDPRLGHHGVRASSSSGQSPRRSSMTTPFFESYTLESSLGRRSLSQRSPTSPSTQLEATTSTNPVAPTDLNAGETASTPYSNASSPATGPSQSVFPINGASSEGGASRRASRRRTGPLSAESRERAGVIRRLGACPDCRRRRVACHPSHKGLSWSEARGQTGSISESLRELAPVSPGTSFRPVNAIHHDGHDQMELDPSPISPESDHQPTRTRRPLPTGPRLERTAQAALSIPPIEPARTPDHNVASVTTHFPAINHRYERVDVLLLLWEDESLEAVGGIVEDLRTVWESHYNFVCHIGRIPPSSGSLSSWRWVSDAMRRFVGENDQRSAMKIVYYNGQAILNQNREMVLVNSPQSGQASEIRWLSIQTILEEATADTVLLMDCPYMGDATRRQGILEVLAAGSFDGTQEALGRCDFTRALIDHLRRRLRQTFRQPFTVAELHSEIRSDYLRIYRDWRYDEEYLSRFPFPFFQQVASSCLFPSIQLKPLRPVSASSSEPRSRITIDITATDMSLDAFRQWARLLPMGDRETTIVLRHRADSQQNMLLANSSSI